MLILSRALLGFHSGLAGVTISASCNAESHGNAERDTERDTECVTFSLFCECTERGQKKYYYLQNKYVILTQLGAHAQFSLLAVLKIPKDMRNA